MADDELSRVFSALADPTRRDMVARLAVGDATVGELAEPYDVTVQAVSKHLKVLEDAGLVSRTRDAQRRPVHLEAEVFDLMTKWIERYRQQAEERFQRLDALLARMEDEGRDRQRSRRRRSSIMSTTTKHEARSRPDPDLPTGHHHPRVRRPAGAGLPRLGRPRAVSSSGSGRAPIDMDDRRVGLPHRRQLPLRAGRDGEEMAGFYGSFHEARPGERLVQTFTWEGMPDGVSLETMTFEALAGGRCRIARCLGRRLDGGRRPGCWPAAWRSASTRATRSSTSCSSGAWTDDRPADEHRRVAGALHRAGAGHHRLGRPCPGRGLGRARRRPPPGGVVPGVPRGRRRGRARARPVGRRRPGRGLAGAQPTPSRRCSTTPRPPTRC